MVVESKLLQNYLSPRVCQSSLYISMILIPWLNG